MPSQMPRNLISVRELERIGVGRTLGIGISARLSGASRGYSINPDFPIHPEDIRLCASDRNDVFWKGTRVYVGLIDLSN